jgi:hypothetical protein
LFHGVRLRWLLDQSRIFLRRRTDDLQPPEWQDLPANLKRTGVGQIAAMICHSDHLPGQQIWSVA